VRLGGGNRTPPRPGQGRRLYETLAEQLADFELSQKLELGGALLDPAAWDQLPGWMRKVFEVAAQRIGNP